MYAADVLPSPAHILSEIDFIFAPLLYTHGVYAKKWKNRAFGALLLTAFAAGAAAQSNEVVDEILEQSVIEYGHAAYILLSATGAIDDAASVTDAHALLEDNAAELPQSPLGYESGQPINLGEFSGMAMESFGIGGGVMYALLPGPRYAARELAFRGIIQGDAYPRMDLSGERALRILGRILALEENGTLQ